jgi:hypothetical protein
MRVTVVRPNPLRPSANVEYAAVSRAACVENHDA